MAVRTMPGRVLPWELSTANSRSSLMNTWKRMTTADSFSETLVTAWDQAQRNGTSFGAKTKVIPRHIDMKSSCGNGTDAVSSGRRSCVRAANTFADGRLLEHTVFVTLIFGQTFQTGLT